MTNEERKEKFFELVNNAIQTDEDNDYVVGEYIYNEVVQLFEEPVWTTYDDCSCCVDENKS